MSTCQAVAEAERRVTAVYEERMQVMLGHDTGTYLLRGTITTHVDPSSPQELTTLQAKMASVKGELKDAFEETALAKHNEDLARAATAKTLAQQTALRAEIEQLRDQMDQMREEREQEAAAKGSKHNQEAVIRRLDNERQYLKSQLASEITLKNELHEALSACQTQLSETQAQWRSDVEALKETTAQTVRDSALAQQRLHQTALTLEAEVAALSSQNKELKEGFTKMRDQVRLSLPLPLPPTATPPSRGCPRALTGAATCCLASHHRCAPSSCLWRPPQPPTASCWSKWSWRVPTRCGRSKRWPTRLPTTTARYTATH